jgi:hypothetical protein
MMEDLVTLLLPVHVEFLIQKGIEVPVGPGKTFGDHYLAATLLNMPQKSLVIGVKVVLVFRRGRKRCLGVERFEVAQCSARGDSGSCE